MWELAEDSAGVLTCRVAKLTHEQRMDGWMDGCVALYCSSRPAYDGCSQVWLPISYHF